MTVLAIPASNSFNPSTPTSDQHVTSPDSIHTIIQQTGNENSQTYQVEVVILI